MNLKFEFFYDNNFIDLSLNVLNKDCKDIIKFISNEYKKSIKFIKIYENDSLLKTSFNKWNVNSNYIIFIENTFINIIIKLKKEKYKVTSIRIKY